MTSPATRQVVQRGASNCTTSVSGIYTGSPSSITASVSPISGYPGSGTSPSTMTIHTDGTFSGSVTFVPGWYTMAVSASPSGFTNYVDRVGCGEVFVVIGQSTAANFGNTQLTVTSDMANMTDSSGAWALANDPQLNNGPNGGSDGSPWPPFFNALITHLNVPVATWNIAIGDSDSTEWMPGNASGFYAYLKQAVQTLGINSFRSVLMQQGENDGYEGTPQATYVSNWSTTITTARSDGGWSFPWVISQTSYESINNPENDAAILAAQAQLATDGSLSNMCLGPYTDPPAIPESDRYDGTHMNSVGLNTNGQLWEQAVVSCFGW